MTPKTATSPIATPTIVLSIAGFDPSSGAGITADLHTFAAHGLFGTSAITALTVQSTLGVAAVERVSAALLQHTLDHLSADLPPAGIKIGMLATAEIVTTVAAFVARLKAVHPSIPVVLDPVLVSSSGKPLLSAEGVAALHHHLLPLVDWVTPNLAELHELTQSAASVADGLHLLAHRHPHLHLVATGGDHPGPTVTDTLLTPAGDLHTFTSPRLDSTSTHGTGCAFSSALLSNLVLGLTPTEAVAAAKNYVAEAIRSAPTIGHGRGPLNLLWPLTER